MLRILNFFFLFCLFFLCGCSMITSASGHYEIKTDTGTYLCDYSKGESFKCDKLNEEN